MTETHHTHAGRGSEKAAYSAQTIIAHTECKLGARFKPMNATQLAVETGVCTLYHTSLCPSHMAHTTCTCVERTTHTCTHTQLKQLSVDPVDWVWPGSACSDIHSSLALHTRNTAVNNTMLLANGIISWPGGWLCINFS